MIRSIAKTLSVALVLVPCFIACSSSATSTDSTSDAGSACATAGGECVGLSATSCADGHVGAAAQYSCGSAVGVECCLPGKKDAGADAAADDAGNRCSAAGGTCVGLSPGSCADGRVGDATLYACGGGVGSECCFPITGDAGVLDGGGDAGDPCTAAGGECVGLSPSACANGYVGDATRYACGAGVGTECCFTAN